MKTNLILTLIFLIFAHPSYSQTPTPTATPDSSENVVKARPNTAFVISDLRSNNSQNVVLGKAINLVKPPYPPAAKAVRASGAVNVNVLIDENGNVVNAKAISGHQFLSPTAEAAARASKFSPTFVNGEKVKASGSIVYNFEIISGFNTTVKITAFPIIAPVPQTLNGKAVYLAKPPYPKEARDAGVSGRVNVQVTINEDGKVISAKAISGPALLAKVSEDAAFASRFTPTFMSGKPVNVSGVVVYNFEPINPYLPKILWFDKAMALTLYSKEKWQNGFITIFEKAAD